MSDTTDRGITVLEIAAMDQPIEASPETTAAFVGRALRGPLNTPVLVRNFGEFRKRFGDVWSRSSLGPAVRQFFEHGGQDLYIVRVANNARGALICLPASGSALVLRALEPGSTENIRAAVDYDGIPDSSSDLFNLTLQRIDSVTGLVVDQELYRKLSHAESADTFVADALLMSEMVRVDQPFPTHRPEATAPIESGPGIAYIHAVQNGTDGTELSDYDLVGSRLDGRGIFALDEVDHLDLLYLPPPGKGVDVGPAALLAAERYCRERGAMLIADPSVDWRTASAAAEGIRQQGHASPSMLGYFPRLRDRAAVDDSARAAGGALAGLLCKLDRNHGSWYELEQLGFSRDLVPDIDLDDEDCDLLAREGINALVRGPAGRARMIGSVTMARGSEMHGLLSSLPVRRLCLRVVNSIEHATRWAMFAQSDQRLARRIKSQVFAYLSGLVDLGAFATDRIDVQCDAGLCKKNSVAKQDISILITFQPHGCGKPISLTLHQSVDGFRVASTAFAPVIEDCA